MNNLQEFINDCVEHYAKFDESIRQYKLHIYDLPDFVQHKFTSLIFSYNTSLAHEANGYDNPLYNAKMLPALLRFLNNTTDKDNQIEFISSWRDGVTNYAQSIMEEMLEQEVYNHNKRHGLLHTYKTYGRK